MSARRLWLLRHADVAYFDDTGRAVHPRMVPLTERGRVQAKAVHDALRDVAFDRCITSGLPRTMETAQIVLHGRDLPVEVREGLREIEGGRLADIAREQLRDEISGAFHAVAPERRFLGGESFGDFLRRVHRVFDELVADEGWRELLVVAHGGTNRAILGRVLRAEYDAFAALEQDAGCVNLIELAGDHAIVRLCNATPYDPAKAELRTSTLAQYAEQALRWLGG
ncbi:MAG TPA: histidine phosphatase family protein [Candidatus Dormibacteraeota bacterium]|nr:histidine phosphatase family protein [Candidatus Dormibacteraeota bacterium]